MGNEASEALLDLVQSKQNIWKLHIDMNMIKYVTLIEVERVCKRNRQNSKRENLPDIRQEIIELV